MIESIGHGYHPATAGRHWRSGARQSMPSISMDSCADVRISVPLALVLDGHGNVLCSSRLVTQSGAVPIDNLDEIGFAAPEHEQMVRERVLPQHALD
jgi:hypothetical protein